MGVDDFGWVRMLCAGTVLAVGSGVLVRTARGLFFEVDDILRSESVLFARGQGFGAWRVVGPAIAGPALAVFRSRLLSLFGGAVIVEQIFLTGGIGQLTWDAALTRDWHALLGVTLVWSVVYATSAMLGDAALWAFDPRYRKPEAA